MLFKALSAIQVIEDGYVFYLYHLDENEISETYEQGEIDIQDEDVALINAINRIQNYKAVPYYILGAIKIGVTPMAIYAVLKVLCYTMIGYANIDNDTKTTNIYWYNKILTGLVMVGSMVVSYLAFR